MFVEERNQVEEKIRVFCKQEGLPDTEILWNWIPFSGHWGISTSLFAIAAAEARQNAVKMNVPQRAAVIAAQLVEFLGLPDGFEKVEAVKGYINLYFSQSIYARRVVDTVLENSENYGRTWKHHHHPHRESRQSPAWHGCRSGRALAS